MSYFEVERKDAVRFVPREARRILDVGCGAGVTTRLLKTLIPEAEVVGVEINPTVARSLDAPVIVGDIQEAETRRRLAGYREGFDCILALDVLEHLVDPWEVLRFLTTLLQSGGTVVVSVPNISNLKVIAPLLFTNRFRYQNSGILDQTHLRFFTRPEAESLITQAGLRITSITPSGPLRRSQVVSRAGLAVYLMNGLTFGIAERFFAHQYIIQARLGEKASSQG